jgi:16S rRNA (uracil1498-N3)-methyltransferase
MTRLFTEKIIAEDIDTHVFSGEEAKYLADVLRMKPGELVTLCDGARTDYTCRITDIMKDHVTVTFDAREPNSTEPPYEAVLYQALVKGDKMDLIIQKGVELGVSKIIPVACSRSIVRIDAKDSDKKTARWQKIAEEAARQCGRGMIPTVGQPVSFAAAVAKAGADSDIVFLPWEGEKSRPLSSVLDSWADAGLHVSADPAKKPVISFFIGPEGGFDPKEIDIADKAGVRTVTLGRRILRTETAGLAVLSMLIYRLERL